MVKAWDFQDLIVKLKANGLVMAEKEAKDATEAIFSWAQESLVLQGGTIGLIGAPLLLLVKPLALNLEDKIDGVTGN